MNLPNIATCRVSIVIKALNEEKRIAAALESALAAVEKIGGEVILADSCSTDQTVAIAQAYPVRIVQLANPGERSCGIGPQLGYQHSCGDFIYILDGDMEMLPGFLGAAVEFMEDNPKIAGVGGKVIEMNTESLEYVARMERASGHMQPGEVDRLDMGGLYRRAAIEQVGYFSNRNLHSYEEYDLAVRLRAAGWRLQRLEIASVRHYGHDAPPYRLLLRRWQTRYICGLGELLRAGLGKAHLRLILCEVRELRIYVATILWWLAIISVVLLPISLGTRLSIGLAILVAPFLLMMARKGTTDKAAFSVISWIFNTAGLCRGFFSPQTNPLVKIDSRLTNGRGR